MARTVDRPAGGFSPPNITVGLCAQVACIWEASARKPGNVHRWRDFDDVSYVDFVLSAAAIAPVLDKARGRRVGETVLEGIRATRRVAATNTNLGILLLLSPLAAVPAEEDLRAGIHRVLDKLDVDDAETVYEAIRLAQPGGLGTVAVQDVHTEPTQTLRQIMALAADRDLIARQYANGFREVFDPGLVALKRGLAELASVEEAIIHCHLHLMSTFPDSLIARKCGLEVAQEAGRRALQVLEKGWPTQQFGWRAFHDLDNWLRAEGNRRNPGTTADMVTACLFVALREGVLSVPLKFPWAVVSGKW